jgi:alpha-L-rhamnosidase
LALFFSGKEHINMKNKNFQVSTVNFEKASPVWILEREREMNLWISLRAIASGAEKTVLRLTGSCAYDVRLNGAFIAFGPARCAHGFYRVDEIDLSGVASENAIITVNVAGYNADSFYHLNQPSFICAELLEDGRVTAVTGAEGFLCRVMTEHEQKAERYSGQRTFCEVYQMSPQISKWERAREINMRDYAIVTLSSVEDKVFIPRGSSYNVYDRIPAEEIVSRSDFILEDYKSRLRHPAYIVPRGSDTGASQKSFSLGEVETDIFLQARNIEVCNLKKTSEEPSPQTLRMGEAVTYRMPCNTTGKIEFSVACDEDTEVLITFDEFLGENGLIHYRRLYTVNAAMWKLKGGRYRLSTFEPYTLGVMTFHVLKGRAILSDVGMIYFGAEDTKRSYRGDDETLNSIFRAAVESYRQNTFTIYMDCPSRERAGWLCDSFFTSRVEKTLTGKSEIERCFLENFFLPNRFENLPEGMFPMCYPADFNSGNFIPNWAMFLVLELEEYLERTGDKEFIENAKDKIYALMNYFEKFENTDGLLEKLEKWVFVEWSECNKLTQDINFPTNMLYAKTLRAAAHLYHDAEFAKKAEHLRKIINEKSFTEKGFYCDNAVYGEDGVARLSEKYTETCQYYAFFCGIATPEEKPELWETMLHDFGPERIVPNKWPDFTPEAKWKEIYPSNAFIGNYLRLELLYLYGEHEKLIQNIKGFFTKMADLTGTLWENDSTTASCNHGFASHVVYWMDGMGMISE